MGYDYQLVCLENGRAISIGKLLLREDKIEFGSCFDPFFTPDRDRYMNKEELYAVIEKFMIANRGKLLSLVPVVDIMDYYDVDFTEFDLDDYSVLRDEPLEVDPHLFEDHLHLSEGVKAAIEKRVGHSVFSGSSSEKGENV